MPSILRWRLRTHIVMPLDWEIAREDELSTVAQAVTERCHESCFLALHGDLGVGKTTFVKYLARVWGIEDVRSPSFDVLHVHHGARTLIHMDAYRLKDGRTKDFNLDDLCRLPFCCAVEWPECLKDLNFNLRLFFEMQPNGSRRIRLTEGDVWMPSDTCNRQSVG